MSNALTNACKNLKTGSSTAKAVLMSMCDLADDTGFLYPSIEMLCERTEFKRDAVICAIKTLEALGLCLSNRSNGRHTTYTITPQTYTQPVDQNDQSVKPTSRFNRTEPVGLNVSPVGLNVSPVGQTDTTHHYTSIETSLDTSVSTQVKKHSFAKPDGITQQTWIDFVAHRKAKKAVITQTAMNGFIREATKAGIPLETAIIFTVEAGWVGFKADWYANAINKQQQATSQSRWDNWQANKTEVDVTPKKDYLTVVNGGYTHV